MKSKKAEASLISSLIALLILGGFHAGSFLAITGMQTACSDECTGPVDCGTPICYGNMQKYGCWDMDGDGCTECDMAYAFDCGSVHNCYEDIGCEMWAGSCGDGTCDNIECETCFEACPEDCGIDCNGDGTKESWECVETCTNECSSVADCPEPRCDGNTELWLCYDQDGDGCTECVGERFDCGSAHNCYDDSGCDMWTGSCGDGICDNIECSTCFEACLQDCKTCTDECSSVADCPEPRCDGNTELWMCFDNDGNGCTECVSERSDCGSVHNCYEDRGCEMWTGSCGDGTCDNIECETCFEACPEDCGGSCSASNLDLCLAPTSCTSVGGNWCDQGSETYLCQSTECAQCNAQHLTLCYNSVVCVGIGGYWCDDDGDGQYECQLSQCAAAACTHECSDPADSTSQDCIDKGYAPYCEGSTSHFPRCKDEDSDSCYECSWSSTHCASNRGINARDICSPISGLCSLPCSADNLGDCPSESCYNINHHWCDPDGNGVYECKATEDSSCMAEPVCSVEYPEECDTMEACEALGLHFCDDDRDFEPTCQVKECALCVSAYLSYCPTEQSCKDAGGTWCNPGKNIYGNEVYLCLEGACTSCHEKYIYGCTTKNNCDAVGGSWCDVNIVDSIEKLRMGLRPATPSTSVYSCQDKCISCSSNWPELCETKSECGLAGRNWCDDNKDGTYNCQLQKCRGCAKYYSYLCTTKEACEGAGLYWCESTGGRDSCEEIPCIDMLALTGCEDQCEQVEDCKYCKDGRLYEHGSCRDANNDGCKACVQRISMILCESGKCKDKKECMPAEICDDKKDNDEDTLVDCYDQDCENARVCIEICDDKKDNDKDSLVDCDDPDCKNSVICKILRGCDYDGICEEQYRETKETCVDCKDCDFNRICDPDETLACKDCNYEEEWLVNGKVVMKPVTCNNNGICEENEWDIRCPNDCWKCNKDGYCSEKERYYTCQQDCGDACNYDGDCDEGENVNSCVGDCFKGCNNNNYCNFGETHENCPGDCICNENNICDIEAGETMSECPEECVSRKGCYPNGCCVDETIESCPEDCKCNNDGNCDKGRGGEDYKTCPNDCKPPWRCGDHSCNYGAYTLSFSEDCSTCPEDCGIPNYMCCDGENTLGNCCNDGDCKADDACVDYKCIFDEKLVGELVRTYKLTGVSSPGKGCSMSGETLGNCGVNKYNPSATFYFDVKYFKYVKKAFLSVEAIAYQNALFSVTCLNSKGDVIAVVRDDFNPPPTPQKERDYFHMMIPEKCFQDNKTGFVMEWVSGDSHIYSMAIEVTEEEEICNHNKVCDGDEDYDVCPEECPLPKLAIESVSINPTISSSFGVDLTVKNIDEKKIKYFRAELGLYDEGSELESTFIEPGGVIKPGEVKEVNFPQVFGETLHNQGTGRYLLRVSLTGVLNAKDVVYEKEVFYPGVCGENEKGKIIDEKGHQLYCNGFYWTECAGDDESSYSTAPVQKSFGIIMEGEHVRICTDEKRWTADTTECVEEFEGRAIKMKRDDLLCARSGGKSNYPYYWAVCNENSKGVTVNVEITVLSLIRKEILCDGEMWIECGSNIYVHEGKMEHNMLKGLDPMDDDFNFISRVKIWGDAVLTQRNKWSSEIYTCREGHWKNTCITGEGVRIDDVNYLCVDSDKGSWKECSGTPFIEKLEKYIESYTGGWSETGYFLCDGSKWTECGGGYTKKSNGGSETVNPYFISTGSVDKAVPYNKVLAKTKNHYYCYGDKKWRTSVPIKIEYEARAHESIFYLASGNSFDYVSEDVKYSGTPKPLLWKGKNTIGFYPPSGLAEGNLYAYAKGEFVVGLTGKVEGTPMTLTKSPKAGASAYVKITDLRDGKQFNDAKSGMDGSEKIDFKLGEVIVYPKGYNPNPGFELKEGWYHEEGFDVVPRVEVLNIPHRVGMMYGNYGVIKLNLKAGNKGNDPKKLITPEAVISGVAAAGSKDIYIPGKEIIKDSYTLFEIKIGRTSQKDYELLNENGDKVDMLSYKLDPKDEKPVSFLIRPIRDKVPSTLVLYVDADHHFWRIEYDEPDFWAYQAVKTVFGLIPGKGPALQKACEISQRGAAIAGSGARQAVFGTEYKSNDMIITYKI